MPTQKKIVIGTRKNLSRSQSTTAARLSNTSSSATGTSTGKTSSGSHQTNTASSANQC